MIFTTRDLDILRFLRWCRFVLAKDLTGVFSKAEVQNLEILRLIKLYQPVQAYTLTAAGNRLLDAAFPKLPAAVAPAYKAADTIRRIRQARLMTTAYQAGVSVFTTDVSALCEQAMFLPMIARNRGSNPWGSTRVAALLHMGNLMCAIHWVSPGIGCVALTDELTAFQNHTTAIPTKQRTMIFAASSYRKSFKGRTKTICKERRAQWEEEQARLKAEEEAQAQEDARLEELRAKLGHPIESEILFSEAFPQWLDLYKAPPSRKPSTYASYLDTYRIHFAEAFGDMPLYQITQDVVQDYYQQKQKNGARADQKKGGLSPKTIHNQHMLLKDFFEYAVKKYKLPGNPVLGTTRPAVPTPEMRVLSPSEMQIFMEEVMRETQRVAILTTLFVGFRVGEVLALKISDLNLEKQTLIVNKNLLRVPTAAISPDNPNIQILNYDPKKKTHLIVQNTPKTSTSHREIAISDGLCELLVRHLFTLANSTWPNPDGLLFPSKAGTHLDPKSFEIRLTAVSKRCEIRKVNPHALRHTLATRLVEDKVPLNIVQGILGHASIETTRKYLHKNEDIEREAIGTMSNYLHMEQMDAAPKLNGAVPRAKFADVILPTFPQRRNHTV